MHRVLSIMLWAGALKKPRSSDPISIGGISWIDWPSSAMTGLDELMRELVKGEGIEEGRLRSGGRRKEVIRVRRIFCQLAVRRMGHPGAEVARYLGVTTSAVNRLAASEESRELLRYA
jgi:hypothetical protein